ncbi:cysteine proteinase inhibitor 5-like [Rutidosis leptorrhynchoides]|uniref:cysteine proteinase inhibitor 5-like n=1 Tax=Rutidosis leptorrhynchoides TaxID=125765 RepID=UPI003A99E38C
MAYWYIILSLFVNLLVGKCLAESSQKTVGNWLEIARLDDPAVLEVGQFAVNAYNTNTTSTFRFQRVVRGDTQIVGGINWRLTVEVEDFDLFRNCEVFVYDQPWRHVKELKSFKIV